MLLCTDHSVEFGDFLVGFFLFLKEYINLSSCSRRLGEAGGGVGSIADTPRGLEHASLWMVQRVVENHSLSSLLTRLPALVTKLDHGHLVLLKDT